MKTPGPPTKTPVRRESPFIQSFIGQYIDDRYEVLGGAEGGMAVVLFCRDRDTGKRVALKIGAESGSPQLFLEEARKWIKLGDHPHIVQALYAGRVISPTSSEPIRHIIPLATSQAERESALFIVLEMVEKSTETGCSLRDWLQDKGAIASDTLLRWAFQISCALEYASAKFQLIHQDIKPANILITRSEDAKLTDFGLARRIGTDRTFGGTPTYMAPEHRRGLPSVRSDIYSFGVTLAQCFLAHLRPEYLSLVCDEDLGGFSEEQLGLLIADGRPPGEESSQPLSRDLARLIKTCTSAEPTRRYAEFRELRVALAEMALTHCGLSLELTVATPNRSTAKLTNRAFSLVNLISPKKEDWDLATLTALQATVGSPGDPLALAMLRLVVIPLNWRRTLRLALIHAKLSMRTVRWWICLLTISGASALLLWFSPKSQPEKFGAGLLGLLLGIETYVAYISNKCLKCLTAITSAFCGLLFFERWLRLSAHPAWGEQVLSLLSAFGLWMLLFVGATATRSQVVFSSEQTGWFRVQKKLMRLQLLWLLPIMLYLGFYRAFVFMFLSWPLAALFAFVARQRSCRFIAAQLKSGVYVARFPGMEKHAVTLPAGLEILFATLVTLLYLPG